MSEYSFGIYCTLHSPTVKDHFSDVPTPDPTAPDTAPAKTAQFAAAAVLVAGFCVAQVIPSRAASKHVVPTTAAIYCTKVVEPDYTTPVTAVTFE